MNISAKPIIKSFFLPAIFAFSILVTPSWAETYYVSTSGSDSNNGTQITPFRTIQKAADMDNPLSCITLPIARCSGCPVLLALAATCAPLGAPFATADGSE